MKKTIATTFLLALMTQALPTQAADYVIDTQGAHAIIQFKIKHLGYSWLLGRFNKFDGQFSYDEKKPNAAKVEVNIDPASIDSNHAERDKHLRSKDFLDVSQFPTAKFVSTGYKASGKGKGVLRLDPHPAWNRNHKQVCFNGAPGGRREVFIAELSNIL